MAINQGATPKITLKCNNFDPTTFPKIEVICKNGNRRISKTGSELVVTSTTIEFYLTQNETLDLQEYEKVYVQIRVYTGGKLPNNVDEVKVSNIQYADVNEFIGQGIL